MQKRSGIEIIYRIFVLGVMAFLAGTSATAAMSASHGSEPKERSVDTAYQTESPAVPSIDGAAPRNFQTASFGLG